MRFIQSHVKDQCSTDGGLQLLRLVVTALVNLDTGTMGSHFQLRSTFGGNGGNFKGKMMKIYKCG